MDTKEIIIIFKNNKLTGLMQSFDIFEKSKVIIYDEYVSIDVNKDKQFNFIEKIKEYNEFDKNVEVIAMFEKNSNQGWYDKNIKIISTGKNWLIFEDYLKRVGFEI